MSGIDKQVVRRKMAFKSDTELRQVVREDRDTYLPEAVRIATQELERRGADLSKESDAPTDPPTDSGAMTAAQLLTNGAVAVLIGGGLGWFGSTLAERGGVATGLGWLLALAGFFFASVAVWFVGRHLRLMGQAGRIIHELSTGSTVHQRASARAFEREEGCDVGSLSKYGLAVARKYENVEAAAWLQECVDDVTRRCGAKLRLEVLPEGTFGPRERFFFLMVWGKGFLAAKVPAEAVALRDGGAVSSIVEPLLTEHREMLEMVARKPDRSPDRT